MGLLRFVLTAILACFALIAGLFAALLVAFTGLLAVLFGGSRQAARGPRRPNATPRARKPIDPDVIDVDASEVRERETS